MVHFLDFSFFALSVNSHMLDKTYFQKACSFNLYPFIPVLRLLDPNRIFKLKMKVLIAVSGCCYPFRFKLCMVMLKLCARYKDIYNAAGDLQ